MAVLATERALALIPSGCAESLDRTQSDLLNHTTQYENWRFICLYYACITNGKQKYFVQLWETYMNHESWKCWFVCREIFHFISILISVQVARVCVCVMYAFLVSKCCIFTVFFVVM